MLRSRTGRLPCLFAGLASLLLTPSFASAAGEKQARTDRYGDPLPQGAIARLGTVRWRKVGQGYCAAFSPDGKTIATGGKDGTVVLWDVKTGRVIRTLLGSKHTITELAFSGDGKALAAVGWDNKLRCWDVATGRLLHQLDASEQCLAFSPDGKFLASAVRRVREGKHGRLRIDRTEIYLWDAATGKMLHRLDCPRSVVTTLAFSPDGKTLASGHMEADPVGDNEDGAGNGQKEDARPGEAIRLWDVATGKRRRAMGGREPGICSLAFSPDGKVLASGDYDKAARLWNPTTGKQLRRLDAGARPGRSEDELRQLGRGVVVGFSADGKTLVTACEDRTVLVWDAKTRKEVRQIVDQFHPVFISVSPDGLLVVGGGRALRILDLTTGKLIEQPAGHRSVVRSLSFSPDGTILASASTDIRLWDPATGKERRQLPGCVTVAFSPDGKTLACGGPDLTLRLVEAATGKELHRFHSSEAGFNYPSAGAFSPDGKVVIAESRRRVGQWEVATGKERPFFTREEMGQSFDYIRDQANAIAFSPDGKTLAWAAENHTVGIVQLAPTRSLRKIEELRVQSIAFSPDGKLLATAGGSLLRGNDRGRVRLWDVSTCKEVRRFPQHPEGFRGVAYSPDGRTVAGAGTDGVVRLWEVATGKERHQFRGHQGKVWRVAFSPDGRILASGGEDTTVLVWDVAGALNRRPGARVTRNELDALWADLAGADAARAFTAVRAMAAAPADSVPYLRKRLRALLAADTTAKRIARLIADLDSARFAVREQAMTELGKLGEVAEPALSRALKQNPPLEVRRRIERLLKGIKNVGASPEVLRVLRAVEALEKAGTAKARQTLEEFAKGRPDTRVGAEAAAAVKRLTRHTAHSP